MNPLPLLITQGDAVGIGPECIVRTVAAGQARFVGSSSGSLAPGA